MSPNEELDAFLNYLRFPSVSADPHKAKACRDCARWLSDLLASWGLATELCETGGHPILMARSAQVEGLPTILLYGHYDVQPAEPLDQWENPPFEPCVRAGMVYARGATDNKGQTFALLIGLQRMLSQGALPRNVIILIEGSEEIGSPHLAEFLSKNRTALDCDAVLVCDTSMVAEGWPAITLGLRGIVCLELVVHGPVKDLHSGIFGGAVGNPASALSRVLARAQAGRIAIPGLYDRVKEASPLEIASWGELPWNEAWFQSASQCCAKTGEPDRSVLERVWARPTFEINGITSGYQGAGSKTIIPSRASAKISLRLVPDQDPDEVAKLVSAWLLQEVANEGFVGEVTTDHGAPPFVVSPENRFIVAAQEALSETFGRAPALTREGISIPVAAMFQREMSTPVILAGLGLADCDAHSPNECFPLARLEEGAQFFQNFMRRAATLRS